MDSHLYASKGAYIIKDYDQNLDKEGVIIVRGTSSTNSLVNLLPRLKKQGPNVKVISAISWELFKRQPKEYRQSLIKDNEWHDSMIITNGAKKLMHKWTANSIVADYSLSPDFDNQWRTGGSVEQIVTEARLDSNSIWEGIMRFVSDRPKRLSALLKSVKY